MWRDLLGQDRFKLAERVAHEQSEAADTAATRLWTAAECMKKSGLSGEAPLVLASSSADGWVLFRAGALTIGTCASSVRANKAPLIVAIAVQSNGARQGSGTVEKAVA